MRHTHIRHYYVRRVPIFVCYTVASFLARYSPVAVFDIIDSTYLYWTIFIQTHAICNLHYLITTHFVHRFSVKRWCIWEEATAHWFNHRPTWSGETALFAAVRDTRKLSQIKSTTSKERRRYPKNWGTTNSKCSISLDSESVNPSKIDHYNP